MNIRSLCYVLLGCAVLIGGCMTGARQTSGDLTGVEWRLTEIDGAPAVTSAGASGRDAYMQLAADSARVTGFTTCNRFFGAYETPGSGRLRFGQLGSTKMACVEVARSQQEQRFMAALESTDRYAISGDTLTLYEGERARARFVAAR
jgi:heat shock protein HslJ